MHPKSSLSRLFALTALVATTGSVNAATQFTGTLTAAEIVGTTPTATGTGFVSATLSGGPGTWVFSYVGDFYNYDFGAYMVPFVTNGTLVADNSLSATATTPSLSDDVRNFHIHVGARGATGGVAYSVRSPDRENGIEPNVEIAILSANHARITGTWDLTDGQTGSTNTQTGLGNLAHWGPIMAAANPGDEISLYFDIHTNLTPSSEIRGQIIAIPEPGSFAFLAGFAALAAVASRRIRRD